MEMILMYLNTCFSEQRWGISIPTLFRRSALVILVVFALSACGTTGGNGERDYFPGNSPYYSFGVAQSKENFVNVSRAQVAKGLYLNQRTWGRFGPGMARNSNHAARLFPLLSALGTQEDGRQYILENIDVRSIMKEYFKDKGNDITLPWQREGRQRDRWEYDPALVYEVKDDAVRLKWLITDIKTPPSQRFLPSGATTKWDLDRREYLVRNQRKANSRYRF
ncbi:MAG: hypothetical protein R3E42_07935 [Burkholderiaceae bacterium]